MLIQIEPVHVALAGVAIPVLGFAFRVAVRWVANGTYVRKDLFNAQMGALNEKIELVRQNTDAIMKHLLNG